MGSWSVYCGISNITINSGRKCAFLPLQKNKNSEAYNKYIPLTLPIFGKYDDYGSLKNIEEDFNTKLIEETYGCSIGEFVNFLVDVRRNYEDKYSNWSGKEHLKPLENIQYMWIDGEVYDFLSNLHTKSYDRVGSFNMGNPNILKELGFVHVGESGIERYTEKYEYRKDNVFVELVSDGTWCHYKNENGEFKASAYRAQDLKKLGVDTSKIENFETQNLHRILDIEEKYENLGYVIGIRRDFFNDLKWFRRMSELGGNVPDDNNFFKTRLHLEPITREYGRLLGSSDELCDRLADLVTISKNMYTGSYTWAPMELYLTPQCGEFKDHQLLLDGFAEINRKIVNENYGDEDDEE